MNQIRINSLAAVILINANTFFSQATLTGKIMNNSGQPVAYAAVGIPGTTYGTLSGEDGVFELQIRQHNATDSIRIGAIGYRYRSMALSEALHNNGQTIKLSTSAVQLKEVVVKSGKKQVKVLGNKRYNKNVYCAFSGADRNYKGTEAAIKSGNKKDRLVWITDFNFYILKNTASDSVPFRLNFYEIDANGLPGNNILTKPVLFKTMIKNGLVHVDLRPYDITAIGDFFISLECLRSDMGKENLNFSGSISGPSYFKVASFSRWFKIPMMGLDFNATVEYRK